ncbi:unnamed protein product, partial [marine sediment metagenome]
NSAVRGIPKDFEGDYRIFDGDFNGTVTVDIGADEYVAQVLFVDGQSGDDANNGQSWGTAKQTIQAAIDDADSGDQIWVRADTYVLSPLTVHSDEGIEVNEVVFIYGGFNGTESLRSERNWQDNVTIIEGDEWAKHCFYITADGILDGFTIRGGNATGISSPDDRGGGVHVAAASPKLANCTFTYNEAGFGGALNIENNASPTLLNCTFISNKAFVSTFTANQGGAVYISNSTPSFVNCLFYENHAHQGAALYIVHPASHPVITNCTFAGN